MQPLRRCTPRLYIPPGSGAAAHGNIGRLVYVKHFWSSSSVGFRVQTQGPKSLSALRRPVPQASGCATSDSSWGNRRCDCQAFCGPVPLQLHSRGLGFNPNDDAARALPKRLHPSAAPLPQARRRPPSCGARGPPRAARLGPAPSGAGGTRRSIEAPPDCI